MFGIIVQCTFREDQESRILCVGGPYHNTFQTGKIILGNMFEQGGGRYERRCEARTDQTARSGKTVTYKYLMTKFRIPRGHRKPGVGIGSVACEISMYEDRNNRPLISAIIVSSKSANKICPHGHPKPGFFGIPSSAIPQELKNSSPQLTGSKLSKEQLEFVKEMQEKVWRHWRKNRDR